MNEPAANDLSQALFEEAGDALVLFDPETDQILDANPTTQRLSGFTRKELLGMAASYLFHFDGKGGMQRLRHASKNTGPFHSQDGYFLRARQDGVWVPVNLTVARLHVQPRTLGLITARDVREQREATAQLLRVEQALANLMSNLPGMAYRCRNDRDWTMEFVSDGAFGLTGYPASDLVGNYHVSFAQVIHPEDQDKVWDEVQAAVAEDRPFQCTYRIVTATGEEKWVWEQGRAAPSAGDGPLMLEGFLIDVTERQRAEETLARERALLRSLIDSIPDLIFYKDTEGRYLGCNAAFEKYAGRAAEELIGRTDQELLPRELADFYRERDRQVLAEGKSRRDEEWVDLHDGRQILVETLQTPFFGPDGKVLGLIGMSRDITDRKRMEEQLRQAQKMEAVGQLAGGVAHDFNNLLTAILGNVSLLLGNKPTTDPDHELLAATEQAAQRATDLTRQLLGFSRQTMLRLEPTDLNASVQEIVAILSRTIDPRISVDVQPGPALWPVQADPGQVNQVLMNLCINARDAMPGGGILRLETSNIILDDSTSRLHLEARSGAFVRLRVRDTGQGIPPDVRPRIFEPFFTTKGPGKGTGLGLAMVYGIVKQHRGWIECISEIGRGTYFDIYLPRYLEAGVPAGRSGASNRAARGTETIMLVDDEAVIRNVGRAILQRYGYQVVLAADGPEALEIYRQDQHQIGLIILDLTMPRLSGQDTLRQLLQINPHVRVLLSSGYSAEQVPEAGKEGVLGFVNKPYRPQDLVAAVRSALDLADGEGKLPSVPQSGNWVI